MSKFCFRARDLLCFSAPSLYVGHYAPRAVNVFQAQHANFPAHNVWNGRAAINKTLGPIQRNAPPEFAVFGANIDEAQLSRLRAVSHGQGRSAGHAGVPTCSGVLGTPPLLPPRLLASTNSAKDSGVNRT